VGNEACFRKANDDRSKVFFEGKAVRPAKLTANRLQPMQMKRHARLKEAGGPVLPQGAAMVVAASLQAFITGADER
jgi:hypothetical protein